MRDERRETRRAIGEIHLPAAKPRFMSDASNDWDRRLAALWTTLDDRGDESFLAEMEALVAELPQGSAIGLFERASAFDSTGHPDRAVPLYHAALEKGLTGERRRRAVIQMASSMRNLGDAPAAAALLQRELHEADDALTGAVRGFLALALADLGQEREALSVALTALAGYLPRYDRSLARYAEALVAAGP